jgi:hypothetical protein
MSRKRGMGLMPVLAIAALVVMPAVAEATPQFQINGDLAGTAHQHVVQYGTLTLKSGQVGEWKCRVIAERKKDTPPSAALRVFPGQRKRSPQQATASTFAK